MLPEVVKVVADPPFATKAVTTATPDLILVSDSMKPASLLALVQLMIYAASTVLEGCGRTAGTVKPSIRTFDEELDALGTSSDATDLSWLMPDAPRTSLLMLLLLCLIGTGVSVNPRALRLHREKVTFNDTRTHENGLKAVDMAQHQWKFHTQSHPNCITLNTTAHTLSTGNRDRDRVHRRKAARPDDHRLAY